MTYNGNEPSCTQLIMEINQVVHDFGD